MGTWYTCLPPDGFRNSINYRRTVEDDMRDIAEARTSLWHYTNVEALYKILSNRTIRFSRIDQVNDLSEVEPLTLGKVFLGTYIACFSHDEKESIPLWNIYTNRGTGARIGFSFKEKKIQESFYGLSEKCQADLQFEAFSSFIHDIVYSNEIQVRPVFRVEDDIMVNIQAIAFEKNEIWNYEEETRIMMFTGKHNDIDMPLYIDFLMDFSRLDRVEVMFDPWMSPEMKQSIQLTARYYMNEYASIIEFADSELEGKIR